VKKEDGDERSIQQEDQEQELRKRTKRRKEQ
jgi:hypothetical protein